MNATTFPSSSRFTSVGRSYVFFIRIPQLPDCLDMPLLNGGCQASAHAKSRIASGLGRAFRFNSSCREMTYGVPGKG